MLALGPDAGAVERCQQGAAGGGGKSDLLAVALRAAPAGDHQLQESEVGGLDLFAVKRDAGMLAQRLPQDFHPVLRLANRLLAGKFNDKSHSPTPVKAMAQP